MKKLFILPLALLTLFACQRNENPVVKGDGSPVQFTASVSGTYDLKSVSKADLDGRKVRIAADATLEYATSEATVDGSSLVLANTIRWNVDQTDPTTFVGIYQNTENELQESIAPSAPEYLKVEYNMVNGDQYNYDYHEAYLTAKATANPGEVVPLVFKHPFSKVIVNVTNEIASAEVSAVVLRDVVLAGTLNLASETIESPAAPDRVAMVKPGTTDVFEAVIMPVQAQPVIAITVGEHTYAFALNAAVAFAANKSYTASITIKDTTPVVGDPVSFTFDVQDWEASNTAIVTQDVTGKWTVFGKFGEAGWADIVMEDKGNYVWEKTIEYAVGDEFRFRYSGDSHYQWGMWASDQNEYVDPAFSYGMANPGNGLKNIKFENAGTYKLSIVTGGADDGNLTVTVIE